MGGFSGNRLPRNGGGPLRLSRSVEMSSPASASIASRRALLIIGAVVTALVSLAAVVVLSGPAGAADRRTVMRSAAAYGPAHHYRTGIAVYDTKLHKFYGSGSY